jgi:hypothetical protein
MPALSLGTIRSIVEEAPWGISTLPDRSRGQDGVHGANPSADTILGQARLARGKP